MKRLIALSLLPALLGGCGLRPLYADGGHGRVASTMGQIEVAPIEGKAGWLLRNALQDRLGAVSNGQGPHRKLVVKLDDTIEGFGVRADYAVTRERRTLRARYQLVDESTGAQILDDTAGSDAGIDIVSSEYATIAAEDAAMERLAQTVADQIVSRIALQATREPTGRAATP